MTEIKLSITVNGRFFKGGAAIKVPELMTKTFEPLKTCDDVLIAYATGDQISGSQTVQSKLKARKDAAKILSESLAKTILEQMGRYDTHNGE